MSNEEYFSADRFKSLAKIDDPEVVQEELKEVRPEDIAAGFQRIEVEEGINILQHLDEEKAAYVLTELPTELARQYVEALPDATVAHYLDILPMDDALELREELPPERFDALLQVIPREDMLEILRLMKYPEDSVGQMITEDFVEVKPNQPMADVLRHIREAPETKYETVNYIFVLDESRHLLGVFSLRQAVRANPSTPAKDLMLTDYVSTTAHTPAEDAARLITRYGLYSIPVLDDRGRMLGIFTVDDAQEVLVEANTEDVLKLGAVSGDAESYLSLGVVQLAKRRVPWLFALFIAETFTGAVLRYYGQSDGGLAISPLVYFIPLLIGAGGNSGSQVTTTITRALALREINPSDWLLVLRKEFLTALIVGATLGTAGYLRALLWGTDFNLSLVIAMALPMIVIWAAAVGSLLPITARRLNIDPAVMSAPFITTFVDATGLVIYFEMAKLIIG